MPAFDLDLPSCRRANVLASCGLLLVLGLASFFPATAWAEPRVEFELVTTPEFPIDGHRRWIEVLEKLNLANLRFRGSRDGDRAEIKSTGQGDSASHRVVGILNGENQLILPGGKFSINDSAKIQAWVDRVKAGGEAGATTKPVAFGLLPKELAQVHAALAAPVSFSTLDLSPAAAVAKLGEGIELKIAIDLASKKRLASEETTRDQLQGVSSGTALAALLRPLGLVFVPERIGRGELRLRLAESSSVEKFWPVGWPPKDRDVDAVPDLMKYLNVEMKDTPLEEALTSVTGRLKVPYLVDHNSLARRKIDLKEAKVTLPKAKTFYGKILDRSLGQAKLKYEVRLDEADQPFLWITTL